MKIILFIISFIYILQGVVSTTNLNEKAAVSTEEANKFAPVHGCYDSCAPPCAPIYHRPCRPACPPPVCYKPRCYKPRCYKPRCPTPRCYRPRCPKPCFPRNNCRTRYC